MSDLANDIVAAKRAMNEFYSIKARPSALPPASVEELCVLAAELKRRGVPFPPSYRAFLTGCNGIPALRSQPRSAPGRHGYAAG